MNRKVLILSAIIVSLLIVLSTLVFKGKEGTRGARRDTGDQAAIVYGRANDLLKKGNYDQAISDLEGIVENYKDSGFYEEALKSLVSAYVQAGDYAKSKFYSEMLAENFGKEKIIPVKSGKPQPVPKVENETAAGTNKPAQPAPLSPQEKEKLPEIPAPVSEKSSDAALAPSPVKTQPDVLEAADKLPENTTRTKDKYVVEYEVQYGDSLTRISKKFNTTIEYIMKLNYLQSDMIRMGQILRIDISRFSIYVDKAANKMVLKKNGQPFKEYTVSTGRNNSTPVGVFTVVDKMVEPAWTKPGVGTVLPEDKQYELGARWIPISVTGYGIHGTNDESSIGGQVTSGCVRMKNAEVIEVFDFIPKGTEVEIVDGQKPSSGTETQKQETNNQQPTTDN